MLRALPNRNRSRAASLGVPRPATAIPMRPESSGTTMTRPALPSKPVASAHVRIRLSWLPSHASSPTLVTATSGVDGKSSDANESAGINGPPGSRTEPIQLDVARKSRQIRATHASPIALTAPWVRRSSRDRVAERAAPSPASAAREDIVATRAIPVNPMAPAIGTNWRTDLAALRKSPADVARSAALRLSSISSSARPKSRSAEG